jgi:hypothetical protein
LYSVGDPTLTELGGLIRCWLELAPAKGKRDQNELNLDQTDLVGQGGTGTRTVNTQPSQKNAGLELSCSREALGRSEGRTA